MNIFIHRDGQNYGPYTLEQAKEYVTDGSLLESDLAWHEGCADWISLKDIITPVIAPSRSPKLASSQSVVVPLETKRRVATSDATQPRVKKTVAKAGNKQLSTQKIVGLIIGVVFILIIIVCFVYAALIPIGSSVTYKSTAVNTALPTATPMSITGGSPTPTPEATLQSQQKQESEEKTHLTAASLIGTYSGTNEEKEAVTLQLNEDYTFVLTVTATPSKRIEGVWKIVTSSSNDYISLLTPNGETVLMDEFTDPDHPGDLVDSHDDILTKTELK